FTHNVSEVLKRLSWPDLAARRAHRGLITRELTGAQLRRLIQIAEKLLEEAVEMPESRSPEKVYSLCILLGERFQRALDRTPFLSQKKQNLSANKENSNA